MLKTTPAVRLVSILFRSLSVFLISALLVPAIVIGESGKGDLVRTGSRSDRPQSAPVSAPPEAFHIGATSTTPNPFATFTANLTASLVSFTTSFGTSIGATTKERSVNSDETLPVESVESEAEPSVETPPAPPPSAAAAVKFDFDDDGKADISRARVATNSSSSVHEFRFRKSTNGTFDDYSLGNGTGTIAPGDFNGDGQTDAAVFNAGTWTYKTSTGGSAQTISLGTTGDIPIAADYDGDTNHTTDAAVFRPSTGVWYVKESSTSNTVSTSWGQSGDIPTPGDYDGDGESDFAVWRPSNGVWYLNMTTNGTYSTTWGVSSTDIAVPADYDGDDKTDIAVFRRTTGVWYVRTSASGFATWTTQSWGNYGDQPVPADYDGDGTDDYAIWRPKTGVWWVVYSGDSSINTLELGVQGNTAVPSAYLQQVNGSVPTNELAAERLKPRNETGGTNLYSQNFSWGRNLVSLPGRAGLDMSLGIGYNSLVWTKAGSEIYFDADASTVSPGFRLGFPTIEPIYYDTTKSKFAYMMVTTSGSRLEFRETAVSNVYETADSSYTVLETTGASNPNDPVENITITVKTTDGTQLKYEWKDGAFRCTLIKDRNGNYISAVYDAYGNLDYVTDTLGRVIKVRYVDGYPSAIEQAWGSGTNGSGALNNIDTTPHTWATFTYRNETVTTNFGSIPVIGPPNDTVLKVLEKVTYSDGSHTKFTYNSYGQVYKVSNIAADSSTHVLNSTEVNIASPGSSTDCPRFTSTSTIVENFNMSGSNPQAVVVTNTAPVSDGYSLPGSLTGDASKVVVAVTSHPQELYSQVYFGNSGWKEGLPLATEDCTGSVTNDCTTRKRWTWNDHEQDNTSVSYILNPRLKESRVGDGTNTKKTTISYYGTSSFSLPEYVRVYDTDLSTIRKESYTTYNLDSAYTSRRIIGLPATVQVKGLETTGLNLMSKATFGYDEGGYTETVQSLSNATKHCTSTSTDCPTAYGTSFSYRGNQTSIRRWDATAATTESASVLSSVKYNIAGSPISRTTPWYGTNTRTVSIGYTDAWNDNPNPNRTTYAYPTTVTDPNNQSSNVKYRFDIGANVEATSPAPHNQTYGKTTKRVYDSLGRLEKNTILVDATEKAYTRYSRPNPDNGTQLFTHSTLVDSGTAGLDAGDEVTTETLTDGAGRVRMSRVPHTFSGGSTATWAATLVEYDMLGRIKRQSVPTEINSSWNPTGDDSAFLWTYQKYDWMNRVVRKINTDGIDQTTYNDSDVLISYEGCGCAGGMVTTVESEVVPRTDTTGNARRKQKIYEDILGRTWKAETYQWNGTSLYSSVAHTFNGRDQITQSRQTDESSTENPKPFQDTTATFDGHGRLASSHKPEQRDGSTLKYTTYNYNPDDSISSVTDGRGAVTAYTYNSRGLATNIGWTVPSGSGITDPTDITLSYDNIGNRTAMTDGLGSVAYAYNSLSQMTSETRTFSDTLSEKPTGNYNIGYEYTLGGQLKSYTDPYGEEIEYAHDKTGRLDAVTGTSFGGVTNYADTPGYRAWGALKHLEYGNDFQMDATYNTRLQAATFKVSKPGDTNNIPFDQSYEYLKDGKLKLMDRANDGTQQRFDRSFTYDHTGQVKDAKSGIEAHGQSQTNLLHLPYRQSYTHNAFGNLTGRESTLWNYTSGDWDFAYAVTNNRVSIYGYDADGRQTSGDDDTSFKYDASGAMVETSRTENNETTLRRDGAGREAVRSQRTWNSTSSSWNAWEARYFIHSSVLGRNVSEAGTTGKKKRTYVIAAGTVVARQAVNDADQESVGWEHREPGGLSARTTAVSGGSAGEAAVTEELDALGNNVGLHGDFTRPPAPYTNSPSGVDRQIFNDMNLGDCEVDGILTPCSMARRLLGSGAAIIDWSQTSYWALSAIGVTAIFHPNSGRTPPDLQDAPADTIRVDTQQDGGTWEYVVSSWDLRQQTRVRLTNEEVEAVRDRVQSEVTNNDICAKFIEQLAFATLGKKVSAAELLNEGIDRVKNSRGFHWAAIPGHGGDATYHKIGSEFANIGEIWYKDKKNAMYPPNVAGLIHEILHVAARGDDLELSVAVQRLGIEVLDDSGKILKYPTDPDNRNLGYSRYWGQALKNHCGPGTLKPIVPISILPL